MVAVDHEASGGSCPFHFDCIMFTLVATYGLSVSFNTCTIIMIILVSCSP